MTDAMKSEFDINYNLLRFLLRKSLRKLLRSFKLVEISDEVYYMDNYLSLLLFIYLDYSDEIIN
jgi:hypothetical protein